MTDEERVAENKQTYTRWFANFPSTHAQAGQTVEVTPVAALGPQLTAEEARVLLESTEYKVQYGQSYSDLETSEWRDTLEQTKAKLSLIANGEKPSWEKDGVDAYARAKALRDGEKP